LPSMIRCTSICQMQEISHGFMSLKKYYFKI
jgi:hypothetical protein